MSFKHSSFSSSEVMRSLERVAIEKGLVSPEPIKKKAAQKKVIANYSPGSSLLENIVKLCSGLQKAGLNHYSKDVEEAFFTFKSAESDLYRAHSETGEDLLETAHPEGSHKMKDMIGDAVIEDLIDQHLKMLQVVEKKPSGKLSSAADVIRAVKIVLAEEDPVINSLRSLMGSLNLIDYAYQTQSILTRPIKTPESLIRTVESFLKLGKISLEQAQKLKIDLNELRNTYDPGKLGITGVHRDVWAEMAPYFQNATQALDNLVKALSTPKPVGSAVQSIRVMEKAQEMAAFNRLRFDARTKVDQLKQKAQSIQSPEFSQYRAKLLEWAEKEKNVVEDLAAKLTDRLKTEEEVSGILPPERRKEVIGDYIEILKKETGELDRQLGQLQEWK